ncbi:MAG: sodium:panthothenate symporter [Lentisphaeria bacterium]|nr:sodium:panthothenate symporter [Lentisphaeria bacterium]
MSIFDWCIVIGFLILIVWMGIYSMRYVRSITDYLACGRVCGRYVISVADVANGLALITMIGMVEAGYKSGFVYSFWGSFTLPLSLFLSLTGFVIYRFRQTKAMSFGQFIEMRYSRGLRIFASTLRSVSEMLANMILPALAGRFFIYFLDLPPTYNLFGLQISTFMTVMLICLTLAISMILFGGSVTLVITDTIQGLIAYPVLAIFVFFVLWKFSWSNEVLPVLMDRTPGESFLNPYDIESLRDFNVFYIFVTVFAMVLNRGIGLGAGGGSCAAKSAHEQKMAGVLGTWRGGFMGIFFIMLVLMVVVFMNHKNYSAESTECRKTLSSKITKELIADSNIQQQVLRKIENIPQHNHTIGKDKPLSLKENLDTPYLNAIAEVSKENPQADIKGKVPEFKTLFHQLMLPTIMRKILPPGLLGLFCLLVILMIISTDDSRIYSASLTLSQDLVLPLLKKTPTQKQHIMIIRLVTIGVGIFFFCGSMFMSQLEYVTLFVMIMYGIWSAGAGIMVLGGLYSRWGTTAGAWAALLSGSVFMTIGIIIQRNWANAVYPWLEKMNWVIPVGNILDWISRPLNPFVVWKIDPYKCPVNAVELSFISMLISILFYCIISYLTYKQPFNLDLMLHRGKYNIDGDMEAESVWTWKNIFSKIIGITNEYTRGDRIIAWSVFIYSFGLGFCLFLIIIAWNCFDSWTLKWWGNYYLIRSLLIPGAVAVVTTVWFFIGGLIDLRRMFRDLKNRQIDNDDNGVVVGNVSLSDKKKFDKAESRTKD